MHSNKRGLVLLLILVIVAAVVYMIKNPRNNVGSYEAGTQQVRVEAPSGESAGMDNASGDNCRVERGDIQILPDLR
ncbi:MAG: hypothetical protein II920_08740 [Clostridia bacterium]|nr:hypothetical protein [Clostridia bacterium]